jgi:hypothetical protein
MKGEGMCMAIVIAVLQVARWHTAVADEAENGDPRKSNLNLLNRNKIDRTESVNL